MQSTLSVAASEEGALFDTYSKATEAKEKAVNEFQAIQSGLQQVISHCQGWVYRHAQVVGTLKETAPAALTVQQPMWHSGASTTSLGMCHQIHVAQGIEGTKTKQQNHVKL